ncbi:MAG TPA: hypothetical protein VFO10_05430 [Oligoflexus sp.]|uniref:hypothetical protein n=1 Tax=Oligoflexus sp. TaxID=1971216 RepID=UPI002D7EAC09|nr:hypothetical protein [Oligoflexus sp.]HET9236667.1 hypothetical protein [Oligoflexus sp.]
MDSRIWSGLLALLMLSATTVHASPMLFHGSSILTLDGKPAGHEAMIIEQDLIVALGRFQDLKKAYPQAREVALKGRSVLPGIIDSHVHAAELGASSLYADVTEAQSVADRIAALKAFYPRAKPGE